MFCLSESIKRKPAKYRSSKATIAAQALRKQLVMIIFPFRNNHSLQFLFYVTEDEFFRWFHNLEVAATPQLQPPSTSGPTSEILMSISSIILIDLALNGSWLLVGFGMLCYTSSADKFISYKGLSKPKSVCHSARTMSFQNAEVWSFLGGIWNFY